ncbi:hypothetical protein [Glutamicibacter nicotianae]|uniref:hypothetical protein n=1 Tax=Glutamicibacter nicotianae TaxID=37929 RepID=UPI00167FAC2E|nr:hypothetical protein [Glutamicibacter nicotianae]
MKPPPATPGPAGLWAPLLGQEAAQIGSVRATNDDDFFPSYREMVVAGPGE